MRTQEGSEYFKGAYRWNFCKYLDDVNGEATDYFARYIDPDRETFKLTSDDPIPSFKRLIKGNHKVELPSFLSANDPADPE